MHTAELPTPTDAKVYFEASKSVFWHKKVYFVPNLFIVTSLKNKKCISEVKSVFCQEVQLLKRKRNTFCSMKEAIASYFVNNVADFFAKIRPKSVFKCIYIDQKVYSVLPQA